MTLMELLHHVPQLKNWLQSSSALDAKAQIVHDIKGRYTSQILDIQNHAKQNIKNARDLRDTTYAIFIATGGKV